MASLATFRRSLNRVDFRLRGYQAQSNLNSRISRVLVGMVLISARAIWRSPEVFAPVEWCYTPITLKMPLGVASYRQNCPF